MEVTAEPLIEPLGPDTVDELVALRRAIDAVEEPDDPPIGAGELIPDLLVHRPEERRLAWLARRGGVAAAYLVAAVNVEGPNAGYAEVEIEKHPEHADERLEKELLRAGLPWMTEQGATTVAWWPDDDRSCAVAEQLGLTFRQLERCSRLRLREVDDGQQATWLAARRGRGAGYRVVAWTGRCPDEHLETYAVACSAMVDAPTDDIDYTPSPVSPEKLRQGESVIERLGQRVHAALALAPDGSAAGMTAIRVHRDRPEIAHQEDTAVVAAHRGRALGRWLKAENLRRVRSAVPELAVVQTYNAESNPWMLAINVDMGFRPHRAYSAHQGTVSEVARRLGVPAS